MKRAKAAYQPTADMAVRLHRPLLALHAALEVDALWKAVAGLLRAAVAVHRVTLFLGHLGQGEARFVRTDPPIEALNEWYSARGRLNPFSAFIDANPGRLFYRFSEVLPARAVFIRSAFYQQFAEPEGWDKGISVMFWKRREMRAMFSLYRAEKQAEFSDDEVALLLHLYPFIETAIVRVQELHSERQARRSLQEFAYHIPVGLVLLDWELGVEFANPEARRTCAAWNVGPGEARAYNPRDIFAVPERIQAACRSLKTMLLARDAKSWGPPPGDAVRVDHPTDSGRRAQITVLNNPGSALAMPRFLVILEERAAAAGDGPGEVSTGGAGHLPALVALTPSEREIVTQVCAGLSNAEIARRLNKSVLTVKTQLNSVFRKLGLRSRARLMTMLR